MALSWVYQLTPVSDNATSPVTLNYAGVGPEAGEVVLVIMATREDNPTPVHTVVNGTAGASFTQIGSTQFLDLGTTGISLSAWYWIADGSEIQFRAACPTPSGLYVWFGIIGGASTSTFLDGVTPLGGTAAAAQTLQPNGATGITTNTNGAWVFSVVSTADDNTLTLSVANGFTLDMGGAAGNAVADLDASIGVAHIVKTTAGNQTSPTFNQSTVGNDAWAWLMFAVRDASTTVTAQTADATGTAYNPFIPGPKGAITATKVTSSYTNVAAASHSLASSTPGLNCHLVLLQVYQRGTVNLLPGTVTGGGLVWTLLDSIEGPANNRWGAAVWIAQCTNGGAFQVTWNAQGGNSILDSGLCLIKVTGADYLDVYRDVQVWASTEGDGAKTLTLDTAPQASDVVLFLTMTDASGNPTGATMSSTNRAWNAGLFDQTNGSTGWEAVHAAQSTGSTSTAIDIADICVGGTPLANGSGQASIILKPGSLAASVNAGQAAGTGTGYNAAPNVSVVASTAQATGTGYNATTTSGTQATAQTANGTGTAYNGAPARAVAAGQASATGTGYNAAPALRVGGGGGAGTLSYTKPFDSRVQTGRNGLSADFTTSGFTLSAGTLVMAILMLDSQGTVGTTEADVLPIPTTAGTTWFKVASAFNSNRNGGSAHCAIYLADSPGAGSHTMAFDFVSTGIQVIDLVVLEFTGAQTRANQTQAPKSLTNTSDAGRDLDTIGTPIMALNSAPAASSYVVAALACDSIATADIITPQASFVEVVEHPAISSNSLTSQVQVRTNSTSTSVDWDSSGTSAETYDAAFVAFEVLVGDGGAGGIATAEATGTGYNATGSTTVGANAQTANGTGTGYNATTARAVAASAANGTGTGYAATTARAVAATEGTGTGTGYNASVVTSAVATAQTANATGTGYTAAPNVAPTAQQAAGTGTGYGATTARAADASTAQSTGTGYDASVVASAVVTAQTANATGTGYDATVSVGAGNTNANAETANATGTGYDAAPARAVETTAAFATGTGYNAAPATSAAAQLASGTGTGYDAAPARSVTPSEATGTGTGYNATFSVLSVTAQTATATGTGNNATVQTADNTQVVAETANATGTGYSCTTAIAVIGGGGDPPLEAFWHGGPSYWSAWSKPAARGWTSDTWFPIGVWLQAGTTDNANMFLSHGINLQVGVNHDTNGAALDAIGVATGMQYMVQADEWTSAEIGSTGWIVGHVVADELEMNDPTPIATQSAIISELRSRADGRFVWSNYGKGTLNLGWFNSDDMPTLVPENDAACCDLYWFTDPNLIDESALSPDFPDGVAAPLAANYGWSVDQIRGFHGSAEHPIWNYVEVGKPWDSVNDRILPAELTGAVWASIIAGATGIVYFNHDYYSPQSQNVIGDELYPDTNAALDALHAKITGYASVLNSPPYVWDAGTGMRGLLKKHGGYWYLFTMLSQTGTTGSKTINVPITAGTVTVLDEARTLTASGGTITDTFADTNAFHLYRLDVQSVMTAAGTGTAYNATVVASAVVTAQTANATGTGYSASTVRSATVTAQTAAGTGEGGAATVAVAASAPTAAATGTAYNASTVSSAVVTAQTAQATGTGYDATVDVAEANQANAQPATAAGSGYDATVVVSTVVTAQTAAATGTGFNVSTTSGTVVTAQTAQGTGTAYDAAPVGAGQTTAQTAQATGTGFNPSTGIVTTTTTAAGTGTGYDAQGVSGSGAQTAYGTGTGYNVAWSVVVTAQTAVAVSEAYNVETSPQPGEVAIILQAHPCDVTLSEPATVLLIVRPAGAADVTLG